MHRTSTQVVKGIYMAKSGNDFSRGRRPQEKPSPNYAVLTRDGTAGEDRNGRQAMYTGQALTMEWQTRQDSAPNMSPANN